MKWDANSIKKLRDANSTQELTENDAEHAVEFANDILDAFEAMETHGWTVGPYCREWSCYGRGGFDVGKANTPLAALLAAADTLKEDKSDEVD